MLVRRTLINWKKAAALFVAAVVLFSGAFPSSVLVRSEDVLDSQAGTLVPDGTGEPGQFEELEGALGVTLARRLIAGYDRDNPDWARQALRSLTQEQLESLAELLYEPADGEQADTRPADSRPSGGEELSGEEPSPDGEAPSDEEQPSDGEEAPGGEESPDGKQPSDSQAPSGDSGEGAYISVVKTESAVVDNGDSGSDAGSGDTGSPDTGSGSTDEGGSPDGSDDNGGADTDAAGESDAQDENGAADEGAPDEESGSGEQGDADGAGNGSPDEAGDENTPGDGGSAGEAIETGPDLEREEQPAEDAQDEVLTEEERAVLLEILSLLNTGSQLPELYPAYTDIGPLAQPEAAAVSTRMSLARTFGISSVADPYQYNHSYAEPVEGLLNVDKTARQAQDLFELTMTVQADGDAVSYKPADIVLVLDTSGSMDEAMSYDQISGPPDTGKSYYIKIGDGYRSIRHGSSGWYYVEDYILFTITYYVRYSDSVDNGGGGSISSGSAPYKKFYNQVTRMDALKNSVNSFVSGVYGVSPDSRIAVVSFASSASVRASLQSVSGAGGVNTAITNAVSGLSANGATRSDLGLEQAQSILRPFAADTTRSRVVVMFTDGVPTTSSSFSNSVALSAIRWSAVLKGTGIVPQSTVNALRFNSTSSGQNDPSNASERTGCAATVYTIGILEGDVSSNMHQYMWRVSSAPGTSGTYLPETSDGYYATAVSQDTLDQIFQGIVDSVDSRLTDVCVRDYIDPRFEVAAQPGDTFSTGSDGNGDYIQWTDIDLTAGSRTFTGTVSVKPKDTFVGGNNVPANIPNISAVYAGDSYATNIGSFPVPLVNVPLRLAVSNAGDAVLFGDSVPAARAQAGDNIGRMVSLEDYDHLDYLLDQGILTHGWDTAPVTDNVIADGSYTLQVTAGAHDWRPTVPTGTRVIPQTGTTGVGAVQSDRNEQGVYTVHAVKPAFGSVTYDLFLGEKVNDVSAGASLGTALNPQVPAGQTPALQATYGDGWAAAWESYRGGLVYEAALSGENGAGVQTPLPANLYDYTPTAFEGASRFNVTVKKGADTIVTGDAAADPVSDPTVTINVRSGQLTIDKTMIGVYPSPAAVNSAQSFVFKITDGTDTFYEVIHFNAGDGADGGTTNARTIRGLKKGSYTVTEEAGAWRYRLTGSSGTQFEISRGNPAARASFTNTLDSRGWFADTAWAANRFIIPAAS